MVELPPAGTIFDFARITGLGVPVYFSRLDFYRPSDMIFKRVIKLNLCCLKIAGSGGETSISRKSGDYIETNI